MTKLAILSDIHANYPALCVVLDTLEKENPDYWICLGDIVGYGPHPAECIEEIKKRKMLCVMGNHDAGLTGKLSLNHFRNPNKQLLVQTKTMLSEDQIQWLSNLPLCIESNNKVWQAAHASPVTPERWEYLNSAIKIRGILKNMKTDFCFGGHTHRPGIVSDTLGLNSLKPGHKYFINPGSVGQPRDGDQKASCGLLDIDNYTYRNIKVPFNITPVISDLEKMGFTASEAEKLIMYR